MNKCHTLLVRESYGTRYQEASLSWIKVGSGFYCFLRSFSFLCLPFLIMSGVAFHCLHCFFIVFLGRGVVFHCRLRSLYFLILFYFFWEWFFTACVVFSFLLSFLPIMQEELPVVFTACVVFCPSFSSPAFIRFTQKLSNVVHWRALLFQRLYLKTRDLCDALLHFCTRSVNLSVNWNEA